MTMQVRRNEQVAGLCCLCSAQVTLGAGAGTSPQWEGTDGRRADSELSTCTLLGVWELLIP